MEVGFCSSCSQVVQKSFHYCPHCGVELSSSLNLEELLDRCLKPLEEMEKRNNQYRLALMLDQLEQLDEGLNVILKDGSKDRLSSCR